MPSLLSLFQGLSLDQEDPNAPTLVSPSFYLANIEEPLGFKVQSSPGGKLTLAIYATRRILNRSIMAFQAHPNDETMTQECFVKAFSGGSFVTFSREELKAIMCTHGSILDVLKVVDGEGNVPTTTMEGRITLNGRARLAPSGVNVGLISTALDEVELSEANARYWWNFQARSDGNLVIQARRDIEEGELVVVTYLPDPTTAEEEARYSNLLASSVANMVSPTSPFYDPPTSGDIE